MFNSELGMALQSGRKLDTDADVGNGEAWTLKGVTKLAELI